eukprot:Colp12_sorted_trinity150504_noHs@35502
MSWFATEYIPLQAGSIDGTDTKPHDHAVVRAMKATYNASKDAKIEGDPSKTLFVGRLSRDTADDTLREIFSRHGEIRSLRVVRDIVTGFSRGYAFVEFQHAQDANTAYRTMNKSNIDGNEILVERENERLMKGWIPRRFGGGFGGRKESGQLRFGGRDRPFKKPIQFDNTQRRGQTREWDSGKQQQYPPRDFTNTHTSRDYGDSRSSDTSRGYDQRGFSLDGVHQGDQSQRRYSRDNKGPSRDNGWEGRRDWSDNGREDGRGRDYYRERERR